MNIPENFDRWMFDYKEGNLSGAEMDSFENFLVQHPQFEVEADAWNNAFVENEAFTYPSADMLHKENRFTAGWVGWSAAAAVVFFLLGSTYLVYNVSNNDSIDTSSQFSENNTIAPSQNANANQFNTDSKGAMDLENNYTYHSFNDGALANQLVANNFNQNNDNNGVSYANQANIGNGNGNNRNAGNQNDLIAANVSNNGNTPLNNEYADFSSVNPDVMNSGAINDVLNKFEDGGLAAGYKSNPEIQDLGFDVAKTESYDFGSWQNKMKRFWNKVEDAFDVPPTNLTNLRDPDILIPNSSVLSFNPGFVGGLNSPRFELNYRNQWLGTNQNSQNMTMSFDTYLRKMKGGVGVIANVKDYNDGQYNDYNFSLIYSPKILLGKNIVFEPAMKITMGVLNANGSKLTPEGQLEIERGRILDTPAEPQMNGQQKYWYKDVGAGFMINSEKFYAGFSIDNLNRHFENVYNKEGYATPTATPLMMNGIVGIDFENDPVNGKKTISASPFLAYQQYANRQEIWAGANLRFGFFTLGGSMSNKKDFTASAGLKFEKFKVIYQYDHTYSVLMGGQVGSHNIGIRFNGALKK
jgi:type IX secretion system PorP/SprF family membrane protein